MVCYFILQQVYFLALEEGSISERYSVGGVTVAADLWTFDAASGRFVRVSEQADGDFLSRRSDFREATLIGLVEKQAPYLTLSGPGGEGAEVERTVTEGGTEMEVIHPEQMQGMFRDLQVKSRAPPSGTKQPADETFPDCDGARAELIKKRHHSSQFHHF